jgi:predicted anti-sigma-YlaC factor YlaD
MNKGDYEQLPLEEKEHFMECSECREMFDRRSLDEVLFHQDHKRRPDIQYSGSEQIS